jgi:hypothetical protein
MCKRIALVVLVAFALCTPGNFVAELSGQPAPTRGAKALGVRTQLRPVAKKESEKLWFAAGPYWVDAWEGGVQSGTLDETVELQIWNTTRRETFGPGFIRFERAAGGVKEGALASDKEQCVVNTASESKKRITFAGRPATVEFGYDGCVMKGTLVKAERLRKWDLTEETYPAGSVVQFNGAGDVSRAISGPGTEGDPTPLDGEYKGTCTLTCTDNPTGEPNPWWAGTSSNVKVIPFDFKAVGGVLQGGTEGAACSLKWTGNYETSGTIAKGMMSGWIDIDHPSYRPLEKPGAWPPGVPREHRSDKLRWTITGPFDGTLGPPAAGSVTINTPNDVVNDDHPEPTDRLRIPADGKPAGGIITCKCNWSAEKGAGLNVMPTIEGTKSEIKKGAAGKLDLIFVIDQTSSMAPVFAEVQKTAKTILSTISGAFPDYRVAIVAYRDWGDSEMFVDVPFSSDPGAITAAIDSLKASGGGDTPEGVLEALLRALRLPWRSGVNKQIILMGDAPPHSPIPQGPDAGKTAKDVAKLAFEVDPAVINAIATSVGGTVSKDTTAAFEELATLTSGTMVTADKAEEVPKRIMDVVGTIKSEIVPSGGGGGGPVLPAPGPSVPFVLAVMLLGASAILVIAILLVRQRSAPAPAAAGVHAGGAVVVQAGLRIATADGRTSQYSMAGGLTTIGRADDNTLVLSDPGASAHHAEISVSREGFVLTDLGSANGTTVNGQPVTAVSLFAGDEIGIGATRLTLTE